MIPRSAITHWNKQVPWEDIANVEQDLIITRALTDIFSDDFLASELAFRGGTALHKLYLAPQPHYQGYCFPGKKTRASSDKGRGST